MSQIFPTRHSDTLLRSGACPVFVSVLQATDASEGILRRYICENTSDMNVFCAIIDLPDDVEFSLCVQAEV